MAAARGEDQCLLLKNTPLHEHLAGPVRSQIFMMYKAFKTFMEAVRSLLRPRYMMDPVLAYMHAYVLSRSAGGPLLGIPKEGTMNY